MADLRQDVGIYLRVFGATDVAQAFGTANSWAMDLGKNVANIAGKFADALQPAMQFEKAMSGVAKVAEGEVADNIGRIGQKLLDLSTKMPVAAEKLAGIAQEAAAAGVSTEKGLLGATEAIAKFAVVADMKGEQAAASLFKVAAAFQLDVNKDDNALTRIASVLTGVGNAIVGGAQDLTRALTRIPNALAIGLDVGKVTAFAGALINAGETGLNSANMLKTTFDKLAAQPDKFAKAVGLSTDQVRAALAGGPDSVVGLVLYSADKMAKLEAGTKEYGVAAENLTKGPLKALQKLGQAHETVAKLLQIQAREMKEAQALQESYAKATDNLASKWEVFKNVLFKVAVDIGGKILPQIGDGLGMVSDAIKRVGEELVGSGALEDLGATFSRALPYLREFVDYTEKKVLFLVDLYKNWGAATELVGKIFDQTFPHGREVIAAFAHGAAEAFDGLLYAVKKVGEGTAEFMRLSWEGIGLTIAHGVDAVAKLFGRGLEVLGFTALGNDVKEWGTVFKEAVLETFDDVVKGFGKFGDFIRNAGEALSRFFGLARTGEVELKGMNKEQREATENALTRAAAEKELGDTIKNWGDDQTAATKATEEGNGAVSEADRAMRAFNDSIKGVSGAHQEATTKAAAAADTTKKLADATSYQVTMLGKKYNQLEALKKMEAFAGGDQKDRLQAQIKALQAEIQMDEKRFGLAQRNIKAQGALAAARATGGSAAEKAAKSEAVLAKAIEANTQITTAKLDVQKASITAYAETMKSKFEMTAKVAEAHAKQIEATMKTLGDSTTQVTELMTKGWEDYVNAVKNPFASGSSNIVKTFEAQMQMQRELIMAQTRLAQEQAETLRFQRERQAQNRPIIIRTVIEGADGAITELLDMLVSRLTTRALSEDGELCGC